MFFQRSLRCKCRVTGVGLTAVNSGILELRATHPVLPDKQDSRGLRDETKKGQPFLSDLFRVVTSDISSDSGLDNTTV